MSKNRPVSWKAREITNHLKRLAVEVETITPDGDPVTRAEALALLLWKKALGHTETKQNEKGELEEVKHPSEAWAITVVMERLEGKVPAVTLEEAAQHSAATKVSELAKSRINGLVNESKGPPSLRK